MKERPQKYHDNQEPIRMRENAFHPIYPKPIPRKPWYQGRIQGRGAHPPWAQTIIKHVNVSYHTYDRTNGAPPLVHPSLKKILDPPLGAMLSGDHAQTKQSNIGSQYQIQFFTDVFVARRHTGDSSASLLDEEKHHVKINPIVSMDIVMDLLMVY